jgi:DNA polymerase-1
MMFRGILTDQIEVSEMIAELQLHLDKMERLINRYSDAIWDKPLNPRSPEQLKAFFYGAMKIPEYYVNIKGVRKLSTNRETLEKIRDRHFYTQPTINAILFAKDLTKKISVLRSCIDTSNRFRASFNVAGTETGRWSSSKNIFGTGTNFQNITEELRRIFKADPGMKLAYLDLEQAESRCVAYIAQDEAYINACESGDLHTYCARLLWPRLHWNGDLKKDRAIADRSFYRHFSYRDMSKRGGHATNYVAKAWTISRHLKIPEAVASEFQDTYFDTFPGIQRWHRAVQLALQQDGFLVTALGRKRYFMGRLYDDATLREAVAFEPQSIIGDLFNYILYRIWYYMDSPGVLEILGQMHDGGLLQYDETRPDLVEKAVALGTIPFTIKGRSVTIPLAAKVGYDWHNLTKFGQDREQKRRIPRSVVTTLLNTKL